MSWLIWADTVCPLAFEFSIRYSSDKTVFEVSERFLRSNSPRYLHPVSSELENSGIRVVSERQSVIAVSLNIGGGVHLIRSNSPRYPHPVSSELENSGIRVVSERQSVIAVSLNIGGGFHLIKPANCTCARKTLQTQA